MINDEQPEPVESIDLLSLLTPEDRTLLHFHLGMLFGYIARLKRDESVDPKDLEATAYVLARVLKVMP